MAKPATTKPAATKPAATKKTDKPATTAAKTEKAPKPVKAKGPTIGSKALELMKKGLDNKAVLEEIKKLFPDAKTGMASINWYRNKAVSEGVEGVRGSREITSEALAAKKAKEKAEKDKQKAADAKAKAAAEKAKKAAEKEKGKTSASAASAID